MAKVKFDPNAKFETVASSKVKFDPTAKFDSVEEPSKLESFARGAAQTASLGFADEATGALESLFTDKTYDQARDESRANYKAAEHANPKTYMAGEVGGAVASAFVPGMGALNVGKGASMAAAAGKGALQGGLQGFGSAEGDAEQQIKGTLKGAAIGGTLGALTNKAAEYGEKGKQWLADLTQDQADRQTIKAFGATKGQIGKLGDKAHDVAELARDESIVTPFASSKAIAERSEKLGSDLASQMAPIYAQSSSSRMPASELLSKIDQKIDALRPNPGNAPIIKKLEAYKEAISGASISGPGFTASPKFNPSELKAFRQSVDKTINFNSDAPSQLASKEMRGILREAEMGQIEKVDPALRSANEGLFRKVHLNSLLEDMAESGASRSAANNELGLTSYISGAGAVASGATAPMTAATMLTRELARRYGSQISGHVLNKLAKGIEGSKFAPLFEKAAARGPSAVLALHQALQSNPEYQSLGK